MAAFESDIEALTHLRLRLEQSENDGNPDPIIEALADDAVLMVPTFPVQEGREACAAGFGDFATAAGTRTPRDIVRHMTGVLGAARAGFGRRRPVEPLATLDAEVERFRRVLGGLSADLASDLELPEDLSMEQLLQGPLADAMTHAGQLAMLRRLAGAPIPAENFMRAAIRAETEAS